MWNADMVPDDYPPKLGALVTVVTLRGNEVTGLVSGYQLRDDSVLVQVRSKRDRRILTLVAPWNRCSGGKVYPPGSQSLTHNGGEKVASIK